MSIVICLPLEPLNLNVPCRVFVTAQRLENLPSCSVKFDLFLGDVRYRWGLEFKAKCSLLPKYAVYMVVEHETDLLAKSKLNYNHTQQCKAGRGETGVGVGFGIFEKAPLGRSVSTHFVGNCGLKKFSLNIILTCNIYTDHSIYSSSCVIKTPCSE